MYMLKSVQLSLAGHELEKITDGLVKTDLMILSVCAGMEAPDVSIPLKEQERVLLLYAFVTGVPQGGIVALLREHGEEIMEILQGEEDLDSLPDPLWKLIEGHLGMDREALEAWPDEVEKVVSAGLDCPKCRAHHDFAKLYHAFAKGNTYLGVKEMGLDFLLSFRCPQCGEEFLWDPSTRGTVPGSSATFTVGH